MAPIITKHIYQSWAGLNSKGLSLKREWIKGKCYIGSKKVQNKNVSRTFDIYILHLTACESQTTIRSTLYEGRCIR
jgi:hypothetical protein